MTNQCRIFFSYQLSWPLDLQIRYFFCNSCIAQIIQNHLNFFALLRNQIFQHSLLCWLTKGVFLRACQFFLPSDFFRPILSTCCRIIKKIYLLILIPNQTFIRSSNSSCCYAACCSCHTGWWEKSSSAPYVYDQPFFHTSWPGTQYRADIDLLMLQLLIISWHLGLNAHWSKSQIIFVKVHKIEGTYLYWCTRHLHFY